VCPKQLIFRCLVRRAKNFAVNGDDWNFRHLHVYVPVADDDDDDGGGGDGVRTLCR